MVFNQSKSLFGVNKVGVVTKDKLTKKRELLDKEFKSEFYSAGRK